MSEEQANTPKESHSLSMQSIETNLVEGENDLENLEDIKPLPPRVGSFMTILNLLNTLLGAGILTISNSISKSGIILSIFMILLIVVVSNISTIMIFKLQLKTESSGYDELNLRVLGKLGSVIFSILLLLFLIPTNIGYLIIGADIIKSWFRAFGVDIKSLGYHALVVLIYSLAIPIPITIPKKFKFISYFSTVTLVCIIFYFIVIVFKGIEFFLSDKKRPKITYAKLNMDLFSALAIYALSFNLAAVALPIVNPFEKYYKHRKQVSIWAMIACFFFVIIPSIFGYLMFGDETKDDLLKNFSDKDLVMVLVRIAYFIIVSFSFPLIIRCCVATLGQLIYQENDPEKFEQKQRFVLLGISITVSVVVAMTFPDAKIILVIGSSLGGCAVEFIYPAILWVKASKKKLTHWKNILCFILGAFGIVIGVIATYVSIRDAINTYKSI